GVLYFLAVLLPAAGALSQTQLRSYISIALGLMERTQWFLIRQRFLPWSIESIDRKTGLAQA
ncbi:MAG: hypothetical protein OSB02_12685, partial [Rhodospirillaceae bacterium]|nr:hypothetical protein [Rhodospirillaceae bacterium]